MDRNQRIVVLLRDLVCILVGAVGLWHQTFKAQEPSSVLVPAFVTLLLGPAAYAAWLSRNASGPATIEPSSGEPQQSSSPSSSPQ